MRCPVCKNADSLFTGLHSEGFNEDIRECRICGTIWSVNHGMTEIVRDSQENSFLEALSECVEGDDYNFTPTPAVSQKKVSGRTYLA